MAGKQQIGRDAKTGEFRTVKWAKDHPSKGIVETIKKTPKK